MRGRLFAIGAGVCTLAVFTPGSASAADSVSFQAMLNPFTANNVTGTGASWITVTGTTAEVKIQVKGLLNAPHAHHLSIDALGRCPPGTAQRGSVTAGDGGPLFGTIGTALTTVGDTSPVGAGSRVTQH